MSNPGKLLLDNESLKSTTVASLAIKIEKLKEIMPVVASSWMIQPAQMR